jgi:hypothetical protein
MAVAKNFALNVWIFPAFIIVDTSNDNLLIVRSIK